MSELSRAQLRALREKRRLKAARKELKTVSKQLED